MNLNIFLFLHAIPKRKRKKKPEIQKILLVCILYFQVCIPGTESAKCLQVPSICVFN